MAHANSRAAELDRTLAPLLSDPETIARMEALSRRGRPAVEAIGAKVAEFAPDLNDGGKQHVGRLVRDVLGRRGWRPVRKARVAPGNLFSWGAVFDRPKTASPSHLDAIGRMERARAILRNSGIDFGTVDDFIAERRREWGEGD